MEKVLVLFSGGLDSLLTACKLIEEGYHVILAHYDNGSSMNSKCVIETANRLIERYGNDKIEFWGIGMIVGYFSALRYTYFNEKVSTLAQHYPNLIMNQANCLACRTSMYIFSILLCKQLRVNTIAEGARRTQLFAIEQDEMLNKYQELLASYNIKLLTPVLDLENDFEREIELMIRSITPRVLEPKCWLGTPMKEPLTKDEVLDTVKFYQEKLEEPTRKLIKKSEKIPLDGRGKMF